MLSARAGTPLAEIEALVESKGQQLAFEPMDYGPILGGPRERGLARRRARGEPVGAAADQGRRRARSFPRLLGGVGPRRDLQVGRPRGEERHRLRSLQAAGRLVRHARGDDRGDDQGAAASGDRGDGAASSASTTRAPTRRCRRRWRRPATFRRRRICRAAWLAHFAGLDVRQAATAFRLEGFAPSVKHRKDALMTLAAARTARWKPSTRRVSHSSGAASATQARSGPATRSAIGRCGGSRPRPRAAPNSQRNCRPARSSSTTGPAASSGSRCRRPHSAGAATIRRAAAATGGHATLIRASAATRAAVDVFEPQQGALAGVTRRVKESFDPKGVLNPGRMWAGV